MDLNEFRDSLFNDIKVESLENMCSTRESFFNYASSLMMDVGEINDFNECFFENVGRKGKKILLDGYYYDPIMRSLHLIIANYEEIDYEKLLSKSQIDYMFRSALAFLENRDLILEKGEEATPAYQFADLLTLLWKHILKIRIIIITNQSISMSRKLRNIEETTYENRDVSYSIWGIDRFYQIEESNKSHENIKIDIPELGEKGILSLNAGEDGTRDYQAYLSIISGQLLAKMYDQYGSRLLEGNVRAYLQNRGKVNKAIRGTLIGEPEMFFAYNNGISATASKIETEIIDGQLYITQIEDLQIVNGGQTTASIFNIKYVEKKTKLEKVFVPMKLSIVDEEKAETLIPLISRTANTQNKVSEADFFSNHAFHRRMEQLSRKIYAPAVDGNQYTTRWFYERSRGQYRSAMMKMTKSKKTQFQMSNPKKQVITKTDLAKYNNSWKGYPYLVSKGAQSNFLNFAGVTAKQWAKNNAVYNENYYKRIICIGILFKKVEKIVSNSNWYQNAFRANIVTYSIAKFFDEISSKYPSKGFNFNAIWRIQSVPNEIVELFENLTFDVFNEITEEVTGRTRNVTEWCKKIECWEALKLNVSLDLSKVINYFSDKRIVNMQEKEANKEQKYINKLNKQIEAVKKGSLFWKALLDWGVDNKKLFGFQYNIVKIAANMEKSGVVPSERQAKILFEILEKLELEGFRGGN